MDHNTSSPVIMEGHVPQVYRTVSLVFYGIIFIIGTVVNLTALWVFALTTKRRNSITVYMINVALVDLVFILLLPFRMVYYSQDYWPFGDVFCRINAAITVLYPCLALWLFALISTDRYVAIVQPRHTRELKSVRKALLSCVGVWIMTLGSTAPLVLLEEDPDRITNYTTCIKMHDIIYLRRDNSVNFTRIVFFFLVPVCIMVGCYIIIVDNLIHGRTSKLKPKVKQKSIRIIITLIIQVLVCFVPFHICFVSHAAGQQWEWLQHLGGLHHLPDECEAQCWTSYSSTLCRSSFRTVWSAWSCTETTWGAFAGRAFVPTAIARSATWPVPWSEEYYSWW